MFKILFPSLVFRILLLLSMLPNAVWAQDIKSIKLISYRTNDSVLLRWAPISASDWLVLNTAGYTLERYTILRDSTRVYPPERITLNKDLTPGQLSSWDLLARDNDYAAIMAQAIYGESFETKFDNEENNVLRAIQISKEQELRFSYSLLAADQSFEVARMAGLGFEDLRVNKNESYLYKLYGNSGTVASDTAYTLVDGYTKTPLPSIHEFKADFQDKRVELRWRVDYLRESYSSYDIEKSADNINYKPINHLANITASVDDTKPIKWMMKSDSLLENGKPIYYRIRGRTPFGIAGPYSAVIMGEGAPSLTSSIGIRAVDVVEGGTLIKWEVDDGKGLIENILVERSADAKEFELIGSVSGDDRLFMDVQPLSSNYYKVLARGRKGNQIESLPYFVQLGDSIPPAIPAGLKGYCDSTGLVSLKWNRVKEPDLAGYRVFRSRVQSAEYRQVTIEPVSDTVFIDRVDLQTLSKKIYYKILAVDNRGNRSDLSISQLVKLKDVIPPVPPRITGFESRADTIEIKWGNSSSKDMIGVRVYSEREDSIILLEEISVVSGINIFLDTNFYTLDHSYFLTGVDSAGNESESSNKVLLAKSPERSNDEINLSLKVYRSDNLIQLSWDLVTGVQQYRLYKSKGESPISLYRVLPAKTSSFIDRKLELNSSYNYLLQVVTEESEKSFFSEKIGVLY